MTCRDECLSEVNTACLVRLVRLVQRSDDFSLSGRRSLCDAFRDELGKTLLVKTTAVMGPNVEMGDVQEAIRLNRLLRLYPPGAEGGKRWELEADPRHVEILVSQMGLSNESEAVSTPGVRTSDVVVGKECGAEDRACYRSWTMRASYLSQDRCELQFAAKELARRMQQPNTKNMQAFKRLVRFLKGNPRCLFAYNSQAEQPIVDVSSDSDWAGCAKTRRSTSSSYLMLGGHLLAALATTQNVVATSSGEAEFYTLTKSASRAPGAVAMAADMAKVVKPRGRYSVEGDCLQSRSGASETSPHPGLVGTRGGGTSWADHRESAGSRNSRRHGDETLGSEGNARVLEASRMSYSCWKSHHSLALGVIPAGTVM